MPGARSEVTRNQWLGFITLCLFSASAWLVDGAFPSTLPSAERQGVHDLVIGVALCSLGWRNLTFNATKLWVKLALASILLLAIPATLAQTALGALSEGTIAGLFALLPAMVAVLVSSSYTAQSATLDRLLVPSLLGFAGVVFLVSFNMPNSWRQTGFEALVALGVLLAAIACVWMYCLLPHFTVTEAATILSLANAIFFLVAFAISTWITSPAEISHIGDDWTTKTAALEIATSIFVELPQVLLLLWLLREIAPARFSARYLIIPLITVIEGYIAVRPEITLQAALSALLILFGAWRLLTANGHDEEPGLMLR